ncbi:hypothetical protein [Celeribacter sp.]|uniref:hypothetical protein n=1 Tax=Celeribacter sp. TaxID=1890673 RepID=UPI003A8E658A
MSKAKPLKKRLAALEAKVAQCEAPTKRKELKEAAVRLRRVLEQAGYFPSTTKQPKPQKNKKRKSNKPHQKVDPLIKAKSRPDFASGVIKIVQGG